MDPFALQQVGQFLCHKPNGFLVVFVVLRVHELIEGKNEGPATSVVFLHDSRNAFCEPGIEFSDFHVIGEENLAYVLNALECLLCALIVADEFGVRLHNV